MLVDTSVWIDFFNGHASPQADRLIQALEEGELITLPGLVLTEILLGFRSESEATRIHGLLHAFEYIKDPTRLDYIETARIYRVFRSKGYTIRSTIDCVIAQLCMRDNLPLLSKDRDFEAIGQCFPLHLIKF